MLLLSVHTPSPGQRGESRGLVLGCVCEISGSPAGSPTCSYRDSVLVWKALLYSSIYALVAKSFNVHVIQINKTTCVSVVVLVELAHSFPHLQEVRLYNSSEVTEEVDLNIITVTEESGSWPSTVATSLDCR